MLATSTTNKALALDARFRCGISQKIIKHIIYVEIKLKEKMIKKIIKHININNVSISIFILKNKIKIIPKFQLITN
jgi:hypothetical protein